MSVRTNHGLFTSFKQLSPELARNHFTRPCVCNLRMDLIPSSRLAGLPCERDSVQRWVRTVRRTLNLNVEFPAAPSLQIPPDWAIASATLRASTLEDVPDFDNVHTVILFRTGCRVKDHEQAVG